MKLTNNTQVSYFTHEGATFAFPPHSSGTPLTSAPPTTITIRAGSPIGTGLHWHVAHIEYIKVLQGAALIYLSGTSKIVTKDDGVVEIPRYARHEWMRFDRPAHLLAREQRRVPEEWTREKGKEETKALMGMDLVAEEWTEPRDGQKEIFFRNLFSVVDEPGYGFGVLGGLYKMLATTCVMWELDNYPVFVDIGGWKGGLREMVEGSLTYAIMGLLMLVGRLLGLKAVNEEYTPESLIAAWEGRKAGTGVKTE